MYKKIADSFREIKNFLIGKKSFINKKEAKKIFYSKEQHFEEALKDISTIKEKAPNILTKEATEDAISIAEQIALTVDIK